MGNYLCVGVNHGQQVQLDECSLRPGDHELRPPCIKVVKPEGEIQVFKRSVTVSELTRLHPHHFVCHSKSLVTTLTSKAVLPQDMELEAGRLYYILPSSKLQDLLERQQLQGPALANSNLDQLHMNAVRSSSGPAAVKQNQLPPGAASDQIKLRHWKRQHQIMPGFAQVQMMQQPRSQDMAPMRAANRKSGTAAGSGHHHVVKDVAESPPMISYSTPDLRSMYLMNAGGAAGSAAPAAAKKSSTGGLARSNSWKPRLETISEVSAYSRRRIQKLLLRGRSQKSRSQVHSSNWWWSQSMQLTGMINGSIDRVQNQHELLRCSNATWSKLQLLIFFTSRYAVVH